MVFLNLFISILLPIRFLPTLSGCVEKDVETGQGLLFQVELVMLLFGEDRLRKKTIEREGEKGGGRKGEGDGEPRDYSL